MKLGSTACPRRKSYWLLRQQKKSEKEGGKSRTHGRCSHTASNPFRLLVQSKGDSTTRVRRQLLNLRRRRVGGDEREGDWVQWREGEERSATTTTKAGKAGKETHEGIWGKGR